MPIVLFSIILVLGPISEFMSVVLGTGGACDLPPRPSLSGARSDLEASNEPIICYFVVARRSSNNSGSNIIIRMV